MTQHTSKPIPFSSTKSRQLVADFSGGSITSDAGLLLLREADRQIGLLDALDAAIPDPRHPPLISHPQRTLLAQRVYGIACGYEDLNDHQTLRDDPLWRVVSDHPGCERNPDASLASPPTLCRLENRVSRASLIRMAGVLVDQFIASYETPPESLVLDFDATDIPLHGEQEGRFFHGYYGHYCYLPLYVFCGYRLLTAYLRPSKIDGALHAGALLKLLVDRLRQAWPNVKILFRGDSGFCRWRLLRWCDSHDVRYIVGLARNKRIDGMIAEWVGQVATANAIDGRTHRVFGSFSYAAQMWDRQRRVIVKAEHLAGPDGGRPNPRCVVTNLAGDAQPIYEDVYCQRGDMENRIKDQQLGLFADRTSCSDFLANQFRLLLAAAAYVLVDHLRREGLAGSEPDNAQATTIRTRLLKVGALVQRSVRRIAVRLSAAFPAKELFERVAAKLSGPRFARGGPALPAALAVDTS